MIVKFDSVRGKALAELMAFIYSEDNKHDNYLVVTLKEAKEVPSTPTVMGRRNPDYAITLEISHQLDGQTVSTEYMTKAYKIVTAKASQ